MTQACRYRHVSGVEQMTLPNSRTLGHSGEYSVQEMSACYLIQEVLFTAVSGLREMTLLTVEAEFRFQFSNVMRVKNDQSK